MSGALEEIATARKNRDAGSGVFVMARSHAPAGFPTFSRFGHDIIVTWDDEDSGTDPYLQGAIMVALALATRSKSSADEGDLHALQGVEQRIVAELTRLDRIRKSAETISKQAHTIQSEVATGEKKLAKILDDAKKTLTALNVELRDEALEVACPIEVGGVMPDNDVLLAVGEE